MCGRNKINFLSWTLSNIYDFMDMENTRPKHNVPKYLLLIATPIELKMSTQNTLESEIMSEHSVLLLTDKSSYWCTVAVSSASLCWLTRILTFKLTSYLFSGEKYCLFSIWIVNWSSGFSNHLLFHSRFQWVENLKTEAGLLWSHS